MSDSYLTTKKAAELLMVSQSAVRNWCAQGQLNVHLTPGGHRRFLRQDVLAFAQKRGLVIKNQGSDRTRILVVDDDTGILEYFRDLLEMVEEEVEIETAEDGFSAGSLMLSFKPSIVMLDLRMPDLDGFSVCRRIKNNPESRSARVIGMTGFYSEENAEKIMDAGAETCIPKPFNVNKLMELLGLTLPSQATTAVG